MQYVRLRRLMSQTYYIHDSRRFSMTFHLIYSFSVLQHSFSLALSDRYPVYSF